MAVAAALVAVVLHGLTLRPSQPDVADASQYVAAAHNLATHGVFSESTAADPPPGIGREPGYGTALAAVFALAPPFAPGAVACLSAPGGCGADRYRSALWLNAVFIGLAGLAAFAAATLVSGRPLAGWVAGGYLWLNVEAANDKNYLISDWLAVALAAGLALALAAALRRGGSGRWAAAGLALAALVLTKGVFLTLAVLLTGGAVVLALWRWARGTAGGQRAVAGAVVFALAAGLPIGAWMARNQAVGGVFTLSSGRTAMVLSAREILNDMTAGQTLAAAVFWTRGFGDGLAAALWPPDVWQPLRYEAPGGFYAEGHDRAQRLAHAFEKIDGLNPKQADARAADVFKAAILARPLDHALTSAAVFWRGLWIDEFVVLGLPALVWALVRALRRRQFWGVALLPGTFSLVFYPLVSINVPRYQMTALPALAIAAGLAAVALAEWRAARRESPRGG
jgi:hypothetical protein